MKKSKLIISLSIILFLTISPLINSKSINLIKEEPTIILVVGFGPFLSYDINPSELIAKELDGEIINGAIIIGFPVKPNLSNFTETIEIVYQAIEDYNPDYVFSIGLDASFKKIQIEKIGYNLKKEIKENSTLEKLIKNGPFIYISPFPALKIVRELKKEGIPSKMSLFGGFSLCNGMLYSVLHYIDTNNLNIKSGFVHVPLHKYDKNPDGMELETMVNATRIIIGICLNYFS